MFEFVRRINVKNKVIAQDIPTGLKAEIRGWIRQMGGTLKTDSYITLEQAFRAYVYLTYVEGAVPCTSYCLQKFIQLYRKKPGAYYQYTMHTVGYLIKEPSVDLTTESVTQVRGLSKKYLPKSLMVDLTKLDELFKLDTSKIKPEFDAEDSWV